MNTRSLPALLKKVPLSFPRRQSKTLEMGQATGKNRTIIRITNGDNVAPIASPYRVQIAWGNTSPKSSTAVTETLMAMIGSVTRSKKIGMDSTTAALASSNVTSSRWSRDTIGVMRLAYLRSCGLPPSARTRRLRMSRDRRPMVRPDISPSGGIGGEERKNSGYWGLQTGGCCPSPRQICNFWNGRFFKKMCSADKILTATNGNPLELWKCHFCTVSTNILPFYQYYKNFQCCLSPPPPKKTQPKKKKKKKYSPANRTRAQYTPM